MIPPDYETSYTGEAVTELDTIDLTDSDQDGTYTGSYNKFTKQGTYKIIFYAKDKENNFALPKTTQVTQTSGKPIAHDPIPNIQANGQSSSVTVTNNAAVSIQISLNPGNRQGLESDWWLAVCTEFGWYSYVYPEGWQPGIKRLIKLPLATLPEIEIPNAPIFSGKNTFYFAVDENADNIPDATWWDYVEVNVQ